MEVSGPRIVSEPFPGFQNLRKVRPGKMAYRGKESKKFPVIWNHGADLSLLKHDFRNPDCIRVAGLSPGKVPGVIFKPSKEPGLDSFLGEGGFRSHTYHLCQDQDEAD